MVIKVVNRSNPEIYDIYVHVDRVIDKIENGIYCYQLQIESEMITFPVSEWKVYKQDWVECF